MNEKQGVAHQMIDEHRGRYEQHVDEHGEPDWDLASEIMGMSELYQLLSAEARTILAEEGFERRPQIVAVLQEAFTRLGLDLEGMDQ